MHNHPLISSWSRNIFSTVSFSCFYQTEDTDKWFSDRIHVSNKIPTLIFLSSISVTKRIESHFRYTQAPALFLPSRQDIGKHCIQRVIISESFPSSLFLYFWKLQTITQSQNGSPLYEEATPYIQSNPAFHRYRDTMSGYRFLGTGNLHPHTRQCHFQDPDLFDFNFAACFLCARSSSFPCQLIQLLPFAFSAENTWAVSDHIPHKLITQSFYSCVGPSVSPTLSTVLKYPGIGLFSSNRTASYVYPFPWHITYLCCSSQTNRKHAFRIRVQRACMSDLLLPHNSTQLCHYIMGCILFFVYVQNSIYHNNSVFLFYASFSCNVICLSRLLITS